MYLSLLLLRSCLLWCLSLDLDRERLCLLLLLSRSLDLDRDLRGIAPGRPSAQAEESAVILPRKHSMAMKSMRMPNPKAVATHAYHANMLRAALTRAAALKLNYRSELHGLFAVIVNLTDRIGQDV